ncbi:toprim domain-containing protein [Mycoplasmopsis opalescens]|uniref:toprim domain-containing protein n=1 Tax=Mycoplasmopsis opalescens TaxID=114886 RepID=UPI0004A76C76|nr:toprim domain-containing protein [Mycoplasmopsis opalescens]
MFKSKEKLNVLLKQIPGITKKTADKISTYLLNENDLFIGDLVESIHGMRSRINRCTKCNLYQEDNKCNNCDKPKNYDILMIVEDANIVNRIKEIEFFDGYYYVLPYLINTKENLTDDKFKYLHLKKYVEEHNFEEIIIVISPTLEGEITTNHLLKLLSNTKIKITRAAIGMPMGSNIDYLDQFTIKQAIKNRNENK